MRLTVIYRPDSEHARSVYEFIEMVRRRYPDKPITELNIDSREGAAEASLYGVVQYPAIITTAFDGAMLGMWEGTPLPLIDEVVGTVVELSSASV